MEKKHAMHNASSASFWMNCSLWYHHKRHHVDSGIKFDRESEAARRGALQHDVSEAAMERFLAGTGNVEDCVYSVKPRKEYGLTEEETEQVVIAVQAAVDLISEGMEVELELEVPLTHEPESVGHVDVAGYCEDHVLICDYKFGEMPVSPNSPQLKIYAANVLSMLGKNGVPVSPDTKVKLAIVQPKLHREALVRVYTGMDLLKFQVLIEGLVEQQVEYGDRRGAGSLKTCEWCDFAKLCNHRDQLVASSMMDLMSKVDLPDHFIEELVRSRSAIKKALEEYVAMVAADEERFPHWTRARVANARKWSTLVDASEIESQLIDKGAKEVHTLNTPAKVRDANPKLSKLIESLTTDQGHHIRLREGKPKAGTPETEPPKRPTNSRKKSARKRAGRKSK